MNTHTNINKLEISKSFEPANTNPKVRSTLSLYHYLKIALNDIMFGLQGWQLWTNMGLSDIKQRYRRTVLGPLWTTLNHALFITCLSLVFVFLWKTNVNTFLLSFSTGYISWVFISTIISESCLVFVSAESILKQIHIPFFSFCLIVVFRNLLVFFHHLLVYLILLIILSISINQNMFYIFPGLLLVCFTGLWLSLLIGIVCARYRDFQQVVSLMIQTSLFITPIFWLPTQLAGIPYKAMVQYNPLFHFIQILRQPLIGECPDIFSWVFVSLISIVGFIITLLIFSKKRATLIFWL